MKTSLLFVIIIIFLSAKPVPYNVAKQSEKASILYALPKHKLSVKIVVKKTEHVRGVLSGYADMLLGMDDAITDTKSEYTIENIEIIRNVLVDENQIYCVNYGDDKVNISYGEGLLIEAVSIIKNNDKQVSEINNRQKDKCDEHFKDIKYTDITHEFNKDIIPQAVNLLESAKILQNRLKNIEDNRKTLITSITEIPYTGDAFKVLLEAFDKEKNDILRLFRGFKNIYYTEHYFDILPTKDDEQILISNFDGTVGFSDAGTSKLNLCIDKTDIKADTANNQGLAYKIPVKSTVSIELNNQSIYKDEMVLSQFCETYQLPLLYGNITFSQCTGGILQMMKK